MVSGDVNVKMCSASWCPVSAGVGPADIPHFATAADPCENLLCVFKRGASPCATAEPVPSSAPSTHKIVPSYHDVRVALLLLVGSVVLEYHVGYLVALRVTVMVTSDSPEPGTRNEWRRNLPQQMRMAHYPKHEQTRRPSKFLASRMYFYRLGSRGGMALAQCRRESVWFPFRSSLLPLSRAQHNDTTIRTQYSHNVVILRYLPQ